MLFRGRYGSDPHPPSSLDRRHPGRLKERDNLLPGEGEGGGRGAEPCDRMKAWSSIIPSILSDPAQRVLVIIWKVFTKHSLITLICEGNISSYYCNWEPILNFSMAADLLQNLISAGRVASTCPKVFQYLSMQKIGKGNE
jgi:hypothetical protein